MKTQTLKELLNLKTLRLKGLEESTLSCYVDRYGKTFSGCFLMLEKPLLVHFCVMEWVLLCVFSVTFIKSLGECTHPQQQETTGFLLHCEYCNRGHSDKVDQSDYRKITGVANGTSKNVGLGKFGQDLEISEAFLISLQVSFLHGLYLLFLSLETFYQRVSGSDF